MLPAGWPGDKIFACANTTHNESRETFKSTPMIKSVSSNPQFFGAKSPTHYEDRIAHLERELKSV